MYGIYAFYSQTVPLESTQELRVFSLKFLLIYHYFFFFAVDEIFGISRQTL